MRLDPEPEPSQRGTAETLDSVECAHCKPPPSRGPKLQHRHRQYYASVVHTIFSLLYTSWPEGGKEGKGLV